MVPRRFPRRRPSAIPDVLKAILPSSIAVSKIFRSERPAERRGIEGNHPRSHPHADQLANSHFHPTTSPGELGISQLRLFELHGQLSDIENSIHNLRIAIASTKETDPSTIGYHKNLGLSLLCRFERLGQLSDVEKAINNLQYTDIITTDGDRNKALYLGSLGTAQLRRYERLGKIADVDSSISNLKKAIELSNFEPPTKAIFFSDLSTAHLRRFERLGQSADMEESIINIQTAVDITTDDSLDKAMFLSDLGCSLLRRFERLGVLADINAAISNLQKAVDLTVEDSINKAIYLGNLGICKLRRFERCGQLSDVESSIAESQRAVNLTDDMHPYKAMYLGNLGLSWLRLFESRGVLSDMDTSISCLQKAIDLTSDDHLEKPMLLNNLGSCQISRFGRLGELSDIEASISNLRLAVEVTASNHPNKPRYLGNLGIAHLCRFHGLGKVADVESAIHNLQEAVHLSSDDNPNQAMYLGNLGISQLRQFEIRGELSDIESSLSHLRRAVDLTPDDNPNKVVYLSSLGISHLCRFDLLGGISDVDVAILNLDAANKATTEDHANKAMFLGNLGTSQLCRFNRLGIQCDIEASTSNLQRAVCLTTDDHPNKAIYLGNLGISHLRRFEVIGDAADLETSISHLRRAIEFTSEDHPNMTTFLNNLSESLFAMTERSLKDNLEEALLVFRRAAQPQTPYPLKALDAARRWARRFHSMGNLSVALDVYRTALAILPKIAWLGSDIISRQLSLIRAHSEDIVSASAACAVGLGRLEDAVELLDSGRSLIWQQVSMLHTDLDALRNENTRLANLADELQNVSQQLAQECFSVPLVYSQQPMSPANDQRRQDAMGRERRRLAERWEELVGLVKEDPKFRGFLEPTRFQILRDAAAQGVIVIINVSVFGVDALIVDATKPIKHVPLRIDAETITKLSKNITLYRPSSVASANERRYYTRTYLRPALRTIWREIMVPVFEELGISLKPGVGLPHHRIWWYPTGPLTFIPIHAAGPHDGESTVDVTNLVVSSYATTLASLIQARQKSRRPCGPERFLLVSHPGTPDQGLLPRCPEEAVTIANLIRSVTVSDDMVLHLNGSAATVDGVACELEHCSWAHFACHGIQDAKSGMKSAFLLHDGDLALNRIASKRLLLGRFAFLSVCHAASGLPDLPGEAMHLAATLQFVGFPAIIATMWSIMDRDALHVANETYRLMHLKEESRLDSSSAAMALNSAVCNLRKDGTVTLDRWAPFIHIGA